MYPAILVLVNLVLFIASIGGGIVVLGFLTGKVIGYFYFESNVSKLSKLL